MPTTEPTPASTPEPTLAEKLTEIRNGAAKRLGEDVFHALVRSVEELAAQGLERRALRSGDPAPDFELPGATGRPVRLKKVLEEGPAVLTFYRGHW